MVILTPLAKSISIPAFREEGDYALCTDAVKVHIFQSPPSVRKATPQGMVHIMGVFISIPAFREEGDWMAISKGKRKNNFNPRLP